MSTAKYETYKFRTGDFAELKLDSDNPGRQKWWAKMMKHFEEADLFILTLNATDNEDGAGGYYCWRKGCNFITLPCLKEWTKPFIVKNNTVTFPSDEAFAIFVHECQHFMHLYVDDGRCQSPTYEDMYEEDYPCRPDNWRRSPEVTRKCEYEASYRAVFYGKIFKMFPNTDANLKCQLRNMFFNDIFINQDKDKLVEATFEKLGIKKDEEARKKYIDEKIIGQVKTITSWADPNHDIPGLLEGAN